MKEESKIKINEKLENLFVFIKKRILDDVSPFLAPFFTIMNYFSLRKGLDMNLLKKWKIEWIISFFLILSFTYFFLTLILVFIGIYCKYFNKNI